MYNLREFTLKDMIECDINIRQMSYNSSSMEETANKIINYLYENLIDAKTGEKGTALIRCFKTQSFQDLDSYLQEYLIRTFTNLPLRDNFKSLILLATMGQKPEWNSRFQSTQHQAIPLLNQEAINEIPMISQLIYQLGLDVNTIIQPQPSNFFVDFQEQQYNVFYIPDAIDSQYIPAQENFVIPFGVKSVIGFGGLMPDNNLVCIIIFLKVKITKKIAENFSVLALSLQSALLPFISPEKTFNSPVNSNLKSSSKIINEQQEKQKLQSQINILNQLLKVSHNTALKAYHHWQENIISLEITKEKLIESTKIAEKKQEEAEKANQVKRDFLAMMSHEIRTPMNAIIGFAYLLETTTNLDLEQKDYLETIRHSGESLLVIINNILNFSKIESGKLELESTPFNLLKLVENIMNLFEFQAQQKQIELSYEYSSQLPTDFQGDVTRINQIIINLMMNALKFTNQGFVKLSIIGETLKNEDKWQIKFTIQDTGIGIPPEKRHRLFKPFSQVEEFMSRKHVGAGLGLVISQKLAEMMRGKMWLESEVNVGSTFYFTIIIPTVQTEINQNNSLLQTTNNQTNKNLKILIAEDNKVNQKVGLLILKKFGYQADIANNGLEVIEILKQKNYDLILMNVQMPEMDGLEATQWIRQNLTIQPYIIAMTANAMEGDREICLNAGMNDYITKPINIESLRKALNNINLNEIV